VGEAVVSGGVAGFFGGFAVFLSFLVEFGAVFTD